MTKFKTDDFLGKVVKNTRMFCSIGIEPIKDIFQLRFAAGGNKFSQLCGFIFDSANENIDYPRFAIAFVCKLRSKIYRQQTKNPSMWYIFKKISKERVDVLEEKQLLVNYGFDIKKFFESDMFKAAIPAFEKTLKKGIEDCKTFAKKLDGDEAKEAAKFIKAIEESIPLIKTTLTNNKYYKLNDLDAIDAEVDRIEKKSADDKKKELEKKFKEIGKMNNSIMSRANHQEQSTAEESEETNESFDQFDWKDGSLTGKGIKQAIDSFKAQKADQQAVVIYDRKSTNYFNIVDIHMGSTTSGHGLEFDIDAAKPIQNKKESENMTDKKLDEKDIGGRFTAEMKDGNLWVSAVEPKTRLDTTVSPEFTEVIEKAVKDNSSAKEIIIDLKNVEYVSAACIKPLLELIKANKKFELVNVDKEVKEFFNITGFSDLFKVSEAEEKKEDNSELSEKESEEIKFEKELDADINEALEEIYK